MRDLGPLACTAKPQFHIILRCVTYTLNATKDWWSLALFVGVGHVVTGAVTSWRCLLPSESKRVFPARPAACRDGL